MFGCGRTEADVDSKCYQPRIERRKDQMKRIGLSSVIVRKADVTRGGSLRGLWWESEDIYNSKPQAGAARGAEEVRCASRGV